MLKVVSNATADEGDGRSLLDEIAREGARRILVAALEAEVAAYPPPKLIASLITWQGWNPSVIRAGSRLHSPVYRCMGFSTPTRYRGLGAP